MHTLLRRLLPFVAFLLPGCHGQAVNDPASPFFRVPDGSVVDLHRDLVIPADSDRVMVQGGEVATYGVNEFLPYCYFSVPDVVPVDRTVRRARFTVTRSRRDMREIVGLSPVLVASAGGGGDLIAPQTRLWIFDLDSRGRSAIYRLACGDAFDNPARAQLPDLEDIRTALGSVASLKLP